MAATLLSRWRNIKARGSFSGLDYFYKGLRKDKAAQGRTRQQVKKLLEDNLTYQVTRPLKKRFPRRKELVFYFSVLWESDLGDLGRGRVKDPQTGQEKGRYFLLAIDVFSKKLFAVGLPDKSANSVLAAFKTIEADLQPPYTLPLTLETDYGKEYVNKKLQAYFKKKGVRLSLSQGEHKARSAERAVRSFKRVLVPYLETHPNATWQVAVAKVAASLNQRYHRTIQMSPDDVTRHWMQVRDANRQAWSLVPFPEYLAEQARLKQGGKVQEDGRHFKLEDTVIIPFKRSILAKESDRQYTYQIYKVSAIHTELKPFLYSLQDGLGHVLKRKYYAQEMKKVKEPEVYPVEKVLGHKMVGGQKYVKVRWLDHSSAYDQWLPARQVSL